MPAEVEAPEELVLQSRKKDQEILQDAKKIEEGTTRCELYSFPEWDESIIRNLPKLEGATFEQKLPKLCPTLAKVTVGWRRIHEIYTDIQKKEIELQKRRREEEPDEEEEDPIDETIKDPIMIAPRVPKNQQQQEDLSSGTNNYWATYLTSQLNFVAHAVAHLTKKLPSNGKYLWRNIYPQDKKGVPIYQSNGRYVVRIFYHSTWRSVIIDDRVPVDANGVPVFPLSMGWLDAGECWPLIIAKALCHVEPWDCNPGGSNFLNYLCGWTTQEHAVQQVVDGANDDAKGEDGDGEISESSSCQTKNSWVNSLSAESCLGAFLYEEPPFSTDAPPESPPMSPTVRQILEIGDAGNNSSSGNPQNDDDDGKEDADDQEKQTSGSSNTAAAAAAEIPSSSTSEKKEGGKGSDGEGAAVTEEKKDMKDGGQAGDATSVNNPAPNDAGDSSQDQNDEPSTAAIKNEEKQKIPKTPKARKRRIHIPHPRCYLIRPLHGKNGQLNEETKDEGKDANAGTENGDEEGAQGNGSDQGKEEIMLEYTNLCPRLKKRRKRLTLDGRQEEEKPTTLSFKETSSIHGAWKRFCIYTTVFPREKLEHKHEIKDLWTDLKKPFSNQPRHLLYATKKTAGGEEKEDEDSPASVSSTITVHLNFEPLQSKSVGDVATVEAAKELKNDENNGEKCTLATKGGGASSSSLDQEQQQQQTVVLEHSYVVSVHEFDWYTHNRKLILQRVFTGFGYVPVQIDTAKQYSVTVSNECGCYIFACANEAFEFLEWGSGKGYKWIDKEETKEWDVVHYSGEGTYGRKKKGDWITLFNIQIKVPESISARPFESSSSNEDGAKVKEEGSIELASEKFRVSTCMHMLDASLAPYVILHWVNNDTLQVQQSLLLDAAPRVLSVNESGYKQLTSAPDIDMKSVPSLLYSLTASLRLPHDTDSGDWKIMLFAVAPFMEFKLSSLPRITYFSGDYIPNHTHTVFRELISCAAAGGGGEEQQPVSVKIACTDRTSAFHVNLYDANEIQVEGGLPKGDSKHISKMSRIGECFFPSIPLGCSKKYLLACQLDPLHQVSQGKKIMAVQGEQKHQQEQLGWEIMISSDNPIVMETDVTKTTYFEAVKKSWGAGEATRAEKAEKARQKYLEDAKDEETQKGIEPPGKITLAEGKKAIDVDDDVRKRMRESCEKMHVRAVNHRKAIAQWREKEVKRQLECCESKMKEIKDWEEKAKTETEKHDADLKSNEEYISAISTSITAVESSMEGAEVETIQKAVDDWVNIEAMPEWRYDKVAEFASKRQSEIIIKRFVEMLSEPAATRNWEELLEHTKKNNPRHSISALDEKEEVKDSGDKEEERGNMTAYCMQKWVDYVVSTTCRYVLKTIDTSMGDENASEADIDKTTIKQMLGILDKLREIKKTDEELNITSEDADLIADARDVLGLTSS